MTFFHEFGNSMSICLRYQYCQTNKQALLLTDGQGGFQWHSSRALGVFLWNGEGPYPEARKYPISTHLWVNRGVSESSSGHLSKYRRAFQ